jgi:hypothetical protein
MITIMEVMSARCKARCTCSKNSKKIREPYGSLIFGKNILQVIGHAALFGDTKPNA